MDWIGMELNGLDWNRIISCVLERNILFYLQHPPTKLDRPPDPISRPTDLDPQTLTPDHDPLLTLTPIFTPNHEPPTLTPTMTSPTALTPTLTSTLTPTLTPPHQGGSGRVVKVSVSRLGVKVRGRWVVGEGQV